MDSKEEIYKRIPHRPPFLWVDRIVSITKNSIETMMEIPEDLDIFSGHYPGKPLMPGVLLCEAAFQTGSLLISEIYLEDDRENKGVPVLTRINGAKFKRAVKPGDTISVIVTIKERVGPAWFMKGKVLVDGKTAVTVNFACAIAEI
ncbi:MAG: beta-hydroxyacyl-ACP dehydratase [Proteobacteria bacterium]|nr:beta-hydroxyacyl-ACP dehydratase [Pseudomonadota bacterium]